MFYFLIFIYLQNFSVQPIIKRTYYLILSYLTSWKYVFTELIFCVSVEHSWANVLCLFCLKKKECKEARGKKVKFPCPRREGVLGRSGLLHLFLISACYHTSLLTYNLLSSCHIPFQVYNLDIKKQNDRPTSNRNICLRHRTLDMSEISVKFHALTTALVKLQICWDVTTCPWFWNSWAWPWRNSQTSVTF
jgi:hypothetical protein